MSKTSLALNNLRAVVIVLVVGFHSVLAYLGSQPAAPPPFDMPPFDWRAIPIIDHERWFGFDLFCAFQYVFLMPFMFFLSGLFVWPSLGRKGASTFVRDRCLRLGVPFLLGVYLLMPVAHYPVYRLTAADPSWSAFWSHWTALPIWPSGPLWFLWQLLVLHVAAAALYRFAPRAGAGLGQLAAAAAQFPGHFFIVLLIASTAAYVPLALIFKPWDLMQTGPIAFQPGRLLHYVVYFLAGLGVGVAGIERGLLCSHGELKRRWAVWAGGALAAFMLWLAVAALAMKMAGNEAIEVAAAVAFALSSATACFGFAAPFLRFAARPSPAFASLSKHAYGIYLLHYPFVIWLQYLLLGVALFAIAKGMIVFSGALTVSWLAAAAISRIPLGARLMRARRRAVSNRQEKMQSGVPSANA